jgi:hypothetical protein
LVLQVFSHGERLREAVNLFWRAEKGGHG